MKIKIAASLFGQKLLQKHVFLRDLHGLHEKCFNNCISTPWFLVYTAMALVIGKTNQIDPSLNFLFLSMGSLLDEYELFSLFDYLERFNFMLFSFHVIIC